MSLLRPSTTGPSVQEFMGKLKLLAEEHGDDTKNRISGMELYSMVYSLATRVPAPLTIEMFQSISELFEKLARGLKTYMDGLQPGTPEDWLKGHSQCWLSYSKSLKKIACVCQYLDRLSETKTLENCTIKVLNQSVPLMPISNLACFIWSQVFLEDGVLGQSFVKYFEEVRSEKADPNRRLILGVLVSLLNAHYRAEPALLKVFGKGRYITNIVDPFISSTSDFYRKVVASSLTSKSFEDYLKLADNVISFEFDVANLIFRESEQFDATARLRKILCEIFVINNIEKFYSEFPAILRTEEDVETFVKLLSLAESANPGTHFLSSAAKIFEKELLLGTEKIINEHKNSDPQVLANLFKSSMVYLVKMNGLAGKRKDFAQSIERTKRKFLTSRFGKMTLLLAFVKFIDAALADTIFLGPDDVAEIAAFFVPYFTNIEELGTLYASALASRLLHSSDVKFDQEIKCIPAFPPEISIRLKRMIGDIQISRSTAAGNNFSCDVLTNLTWPVPTNLAPFSNRELPKEMQEFVGGFEKLYMKKHPKQKLTWTHQLSRMTLNYTAPNTRAYELSCTFPQAMLLLKLESLNDISFASVVEMMKIRRKDVYRHLKPMCSIGLVSYSQNVDSYSDLTENVKVRLNLAFEHPKSKIRFSPVSVDGATDETSGRASYVPEPLEVPESSSLTEQDKFALQCLIMNIAKANRIISAAHFHQLIMQSWKRQARLSPSQISGCLKVLQDKDFLEFDEVQSVFRYIP